MGEDNRTLLHHAALDGQTSTVEQLLDSGAVIEATDKDKNTPLHLAVWRRHTDVLELLLDKGAPTQARNIYSTASCCMEWTY